jgi:hypothetical protein
VAAAVVVHEGLDLVDDDRQLAREQPSRWDAAVWTSVSPRVVKRAAPG